MVKKSILTFVSAGFFFALGTPAQARPGDELVAATLRRLRALEPFVSPSLSLEMVQADKPFAETSGSFKIRISAGLVKRIVDSGAGGELQQEMLAFVVGHELGHSMLGHGDTCAMTGTETAARNERAADFIGATISSAFRGQNAQTKERLWTDAVSLVFANVLMQTKDRDPCHGEPGDRLDAIQTRSVEFSQVATKYADVLRDVDRGEDRDLEAALKKLNEIDAILQKVGAEDPLAVTILAKACIYHLRWLKSVPANALLVQTRVLLPPRLLPPGGPTRGRREVPGEKSYSLEARDLYRKYLKRIGTAQDPGAQLNLISLEMYDPDAKFDELRRQLAQIAKNAAEDAQLQNNLGAAFLYLHLSEAEPVRRDDLEDAARHLQAAEKLLDVRPDASPLRSLVNYNLYTLASAKKDSEQTKRYAARIACTRESEWCKEAGLPSTRPARPEATSLGPFQLGKSEKETMALAAKNGLIPGEVLQAGGIKRLEFKKSGIVHYRVRIKTQTGVDQIEALAPSAAGLQGVKIGGAERELESLEPEGRFRRDPSGRYVFGRTRITVADSHVVGLMIEGE